MNKLNIFVFSKICYVFRFILVSMFIGFGIIVVSKIGSYFFMVDFLFVFLVVVVIFGVVILLIVYGGGDLFIGNIFYFIYIVF